MQLKTSTEAINYDKDSEETTNRQIKDSDPASAKMLKSAIR